VLVNKISVSFLGVVILWLVTFLIQTKITFVSLSDLVLFGDRRFAFFDLWTVQHFLSGIFLGFVILSIKKVQFWKYILLVLLASLLWEMTELLMEYGFLGKSVSDWKFGYELIYNRLIIDPLSVLLGGIVFWYFRRAIYFAMIPLIAWLSINVMSSNSMYVQNVILEYLKF